MGGGPDHEHLLIVLWNPEPKDLISKIKERFPYIEVTYFQVESIRPNKVPRAEKGVPKGPFLPIFLLICSGPPPSSYRQNYLSLFTPYRTAKIAAEMAQLRILTPSVYRALEVRYYYRHHVSASTQSRRLS
jgi:hypothetical protein